MFRPMINNHGLIEKLTSVLAQAIATARVISVFALEFSS